MKIKATTLLLSVDALRRLGQAKLHLARAVEFGRWLKAAEEHIHELLKNRQDILDMYNKRAADAAKEGDQDALDKLNAECAELLGELAQTELDLPDFSLEIRDLSGNSFGGGDLCAVSWLLSDFDTWTPE